MRPSPRLWSFLVASCVLCLAIWAIGRSAGDGDRARAEVVRDDGRQICFRVPAAEQAVGDAREVCIEHELVAEPLAVGDCVTLRQGFPGIAVAGRASCHAG